MHRTLFTPPMIETFRSCRKAYEMAFAKFSIGFKTGSLAGACKRFILKAISEVNKERLTNTQQIQKYMGQGWPLERSNDASSEKEISTRAFLFAFKSLIKYVNKPYKPKGAEVAAVGLKVRARVAHVRVYVEDTIDLILWYPAEKRLELVNFQMQPIKPVNPSWPNASLLVKAHLAERLKVRWPFEKLSITTYRVGTQDYPLMSVLVDEPLYRAHWAELVKTLEEMKQTPAKEVACSSGSQCKYCSSLKKANVLESVSTYHASSDSAISA